MEPCISVTGFRRPSQVDAMRQTFVGAGGFMLGRRLGVGVMTSHSVLHGIFSPWNDAFPRLNEIAGLLQKHLALFNVLHYADEYNRQVLENLLDLTPHAGPNLHAIQLDMAWPSHTDIKTYRVWHPRIEVIIQVGGKALDLVERAPAKLVEKLRRYESSINAVSLEQSTGTGKDLNATELLPFVHAIKEHLPHLHLVVAGDLGPKTLHLLEPFARLFPDISTDAQGQRRTSTSAKDRIEWDMAEAYLKENIHLLRSVR